MNDYTLNGLAIRFARDYRLVAVSTSSTSTNTEDMYEFITYISNECATISTDIFIKISQDYVKQKEVYSVLYFKEANIALNVHRITHSCESWISVS